MADRLLVRTRSRPATGQGRDDAPLDLPLFEHPRHRAIREAVANAALAPRSCSRLTPHAPAGDGRSVTARGIIGRVRRRAGVLPAAPMAWMRARPNPAAFWLALRDARGTADPMTGGTAAFREARLVEEMRTQARDGQRPVVVHGCDGLLPARATTMRTVVGCARHVTAVTGVPALLVGSTRLAARLRCDRDHGGMFGSVELPPWRHDEDHRASLRSLEAALPCDRRRSWPTADWRRTCGPCPTGTSDPLSSLLRTETEPAIRLSYESIDVRLPDDIGVPIPDLLHGATFRRGPGNPTSRRSIPGTDARRPPPGSGG